MTESGANVLVVDDEPQILRALNVILRQAGYRVDSAATAREALDAIAVRPPDAVILDLVLPDGSGVEVLQELRSWSAMPVIVLSAVGDEREKVRALDAGADDYVTKPFGTDELLARVRAVLRRLGEPSSEPVVEAGVVRIDFAARRVTRDGSDVHLTPIEFDLLRVLALHRGKLVTHRKLLQEVWGPQYGDETHYLRVHVAHIRAKLEADPSRPALILTEAGVGYRMTP
jgi:two-component system KDP operon response regulator KdpE